MIFFSNSFYPIAFVVIYVPVKYHARKQGGMVSLLLCFEAITSIYIDIDAMTCSSVLCVVYCTYPKCTSCHQQPWSIVGIVSIVGIWDKSCQHDTANISSYLTGWFSGSGRLQRYCSIRSLELSSYVLFSRSDKWFLRKLYFASFSDSGF